MTSLKIHSYPGNPRSQKAQIAAEYTGVSVELPANFQFGVTNKTPEFLANFPFGKVPSAETADGPLFESNAIAFYVALKHGKSLLLGQNEYEHAQVVQWMSVSDNEVQPVIAAWYYPLMGYAPFNEQAVRKAKEDIKKVLATLDKALAPKTFLVGESVSLADIVLTCTLYNLFVKLLEPKERSAYVNVVRWFITCVNQRAFKKVLGETVLCTKTMEPQTAAAPAAAPAPAPVAAAAVQHDDEDDEESAPKPKAKNPLDLLPPTKFNLEEWKRFYSNNDTRPTAIDWFWQNYDAEGYSMWRVDYKYNDELSLIFMTCNLVNGLFQRMDHMRKYAFGSLLIFGEDKKNEIAGYFIFRGKEMPEAVIDVPDYESYEWKKVDTEDPKTRELFNDYIAWDGNLEGKTFNQGKIFK
jgi:elongation factor 1-gamma